MNPKVLQIYASGAAATSRPASITMARRKIAPFSPTRIYQAMVEAEKNTKRYPLQAVDFRSTTMKLEPRDGMPLPTRG